MQRRQQGAQLVKARLGCGSAGACIGRRGCLGCEASLQLTDARRGGSRRVRCGRVRRHLLPLALLQRVAPCGPQLLVQLGELVFQPSPPRPSRVQLRPHLSQLCL